VTGASHLDSLAKGTRVGAAKGWCVAACRSVPVVAGIHLRMAFGIGEYAGDRTFFSLPFLDLGVVRRCASRAFRSSGDSSSGVRGPSSISGSTLSVLGAPALTMLFPLLRGFILLDKLSNGWWESFCIDKVVHD
jgi:hypothetical protein